MDEEELAIKIVAAREAIRIFRDETAPNAVWSGGTFTPRKVVEPFLAELLEILK